MKAPWAGADSKQLEGTVQRAKASLFAKLEAAKAATEGESSALSEVPRVNFASLNCGSEEALCKELGQYARAPSVLYFKPTWFETETNEFSVSNSGQESDSAKESAKKIFKPPTPEKVGRGSNLSDVLLSEFLQNAWRAERQVFAQKARAAKTGGSAYEHFDGSVEDLEKLIVETPKVGGSSFWAAFVET